MPQQLLLTMLHSILETVNPYVMSMLAGSVKKISGLWKVVASCFGRGCWAAVQCIIVAATAEALLTSMTTEVEITQGFSFPAEPNVDSTTSTTSNIKRQHFSFSATIVESADGTNDRGHH